ncbi:Cupredoxin [Absidia repens]|uniref:Cupredoxin n=1 Tax=Absidia repens TaxID=90262 RepID=A0A1X2I896_9FUNG|nr:Cupredoxin [Absidia repens]
MHSADHVSVFFMLFLAFIVMVGRVDAKERTFELNITKGPWPMNCNNEQQQDDQVMMINGQHPGPPIRATLNDDIHVVVRNHGDEPTTVHYHGILQIGTVESDGMPNITQSEIQPGGEFHARFRLIGQSGTFFYHAHVALQDDSIQGPFIVYPTEDAWPPNVNGGELEKRNNVEQEGLRLVDGPYRYDDERIVQLSEYWAENPHDRINYYLGAEYQGFIPADQYLINGHGGSASVSATKSGKHKRQSACTGMSAVEVAHGKVYRVRVIGALSFSTLGFSVAKHKMTIIEMDGTLIEPYETDYLEVSSGQRYSVLLEANQAPGSSYNMDVMPFWITNTTATGRGILTYQEQESESRLDVAENFPKDFALTTQQAATDATEFQFPEPVNQWIFQSVKPLEEEKLDFNAKPDRTIVLMPMEHLVGEMNTTRWLINGRHMPVHETPLLEQLKNDFHAGHNERTSDGFDEDLQTYPMKYGEVVDVVIHTTTLINHGICAGHPWHSHGFVHYPIAHGMGEYNHETDQDLRTYEHPVAKDTTFVYPGTTALAPEAGIPCGWTKVRVFANNPGLWAFHCHITGHMLQGMIVIIEMATDQIKYLQQ